MKGYKRRDHYKPVSALLRNREHRCSTARGNSLYRNCKIPVGPGTFRYSSDIPQYAEIVRIESVESQ